MKFDFLAVFVVFWFLFFQWIVIHFLVVKERENGVGGEGTENKKHTWKVQNRQGEVKNSIGNGVVNLYV